MNLTIGEAFGRMVVREFLHRKLLEAKRNPRALDELPTWARNSIARAGEQLGLHHTEIAKVVKR